MKIGLLKTWLTNIGNGFIDAGAEALLREASEEAEIIPLTGYGQHVADVQAEFGTVLDKAGFSNDKSKMRGSPFHPSRLFDLDIAVLPGCVLYEHGLRKYMPILRELTEKDVPLMMLGVGGGDYEPKTQDYVRSQLDQLDIHAVITRDPTAYDAYKDITSIAHDGIDCAFWIDKYYEPPETDQSFVISTFDKTSEPDFDSDIPVVRPVHNPFEHPFEYPVGETINKLMSGSSMFDVENRFLGDAIADYLLLYANATETHTDRIHAAIPSLVYGNQARLYYETPRADLFTAIELEDIQRQLVTLDADTLQTERESQTIVVREALDKSR